MGAGSQVIKEVTLYYVQIQFVESGRVFGMGYLAPPTRADVEPLFRQEWDKLKAEEQEQVWEWLLILDFIPTIAWIGVIETFYGTIRCSTKKVIDNVKANKP